MQEAVILFEISKFLFSNFTFSPTPFVLASGASVGVALPAVLQGQLACLLSRFLSLPFSGWGPPLSVTSLLARPAWVAACGWQVPPLPVVPSVPLDLAAITAAMAALATFVEAVPPDCISSAFIHVPLPAQHGAAYAQPEAFFDRPLMWLLRM